MAYTRKREGTTKYSSSKTNSNSFNTLHCTFINIKTTNHGTVQCLLKLTSYPIFCVYFCHFMSRGLAGEPEENAV